MLVIYTYIYSHTDEEDNPVVPLRKCKHGHGREKERHTSSSGNSAPSLPKLYCKSFKEVIRDLPALFFVFMFCTALYLKLQIYSLHSYHH